MVDEETKEKAKEGGRRVLGVLKDGLVVLFKLIMIIITSFFRAITLDFFHNIKDNWHSAFRKVEKKEEKPEEEKPKEKKEKPKEEKKEEKPKEKKE